MAERSDQSISRLDAAMRRLLFNHLREIQQLLVQLKGFAADKDIVDRYGDQNPQELDLDPDTPTDVAAIMKDIGDIYKQIALYRDKLRGNDGCSFRDSGISESSDRRSYQDTGDAVQSDETENPATCSSEQEERDGASLSLSDIRLRRNALN